jgi:phosphoglycolate phosphatase-like HAD superfamily hydrolase
MIKLIIFDWDDVIILGSKAGYYQCYTETLKELGVFLEDKEIDIRIKRKWGQPFREELRELLKENPSLLDQAVEIFMNKKFNSNTFIDQLSEVPGINEVLERLSKKYKLAVATGNQREMVINKIIPKFNIPNVFCRIITSHDNIPVGKTKPHPYMINLILKEQNIKKEEALFVGDAESDVIMARNAGIEPVAVLTGHLSKQEAEALKVKHILSDVAKIESIL